jgi:flagellar L-ring protein FlgH
MKNASIILALMSIIILTGCETFRADGTRWGIRPAGPGQDIAYENPSVVHPGEGLNDPYRPTEGSLFNPSPGAYMPWGDPVAHQVGDIVTVRVAVASSAEHSATTDLSRSSNIEAGIDSLFGYETEIAAMGPNPSNPAELIKASSANDYQGDGETIRSGNITADISAVVTHVYPNGNMIIHGSQATLVNNENSLVTVDGTIRLHDVSPDNIVRSERIANARIEVTGRGVVSDKQRPGWMARAFDWVWPL